MSAAPPPALLASARRTLASLAEIFPFEPRYAPVEDAWMAYLDEGPRDAPPLVCLHGNPTWSFLWRDLVRELSDEHRVLAPDHVGCGLSEKPRGYPYSLERHVRNLERLVLALDLRDLTLVLHDWGGAIGMGFASRHPERVARLVVLNTAAFRSRRIPLRIAACRIPGVGRLLVEGAGAFSRAAVRMAVARPLPAAVRRGFLAPYARAGERAAIGAFVRDIPMRAGHPSWALLEAIEAALPRFADRPAAIAWGERDWCFTSAFRAEWQRRLPQASVRAEPEAGHWVLEDAGERVLPWLRGFLADHPVR